MSNVKPKMMVLSARLLYGRGVFWGEREAFFFSPCWFLLFCDKSGATLCLFFPTSRFHLLSFSKQDLKVENKC